MSSRSCRKSAAFKGKHNMSVFLSVVSTPRWAWVCKYTGDCDECETSELQRLHDGTWETHRTYPKVNSIARKLSDGGHLSLLAFIPPSPVVDRAHICRLEAMNVAPELRGQDVSAVPAVLSCVVILFGLAFVAVATTHFLLGLHAGALRAGVAAAAAAVGAPRSITPNARVEANLSRRPARGAAASLSDQFGPAAWRRLERLVCIAALLDMCTDITTTDYNVPAVNSSKHICEAQVCSICLELFSDNENKCCKEDKEPVEEFESREQSQHSRECHEEDEHDAHEYVDEKVRLRCGHTYHRNCMLRLLVKCSNRCPLCNRKVIQVEDCVLLERNLLNVREQTKEAMSACASTESNGTAFHGFVQG